MRPFYCTQVFLVTHTAQQITTAQVATAVKRVGQALIREKHARPHHTVHSSQYPHEGVHHSSTSMPSQLYTCLAANALMLCHAALAHSISYRETPCTSCDGVAPVCFGCGSKTCVHLHHRHLQQVRGRGAAKHLFQGIYKGPCAKVHEFDVF